MKRVYHPNLPTYQDVPDDSVAAWADSGWLKSPAKHVEYGSLPAVGDHPGIARVPVLEDVSRTSTATASSGSPAGSVTT